MIYAIHVLLFVRKETCVSQRSSQKSQQFAAVGQNDVRSDIIVILAPNVDEARECRVGSI